MQINTNLSHIQLMRLAKFRQIIGLEAHKIDDEQGHRVVLTLKDMLDEKQLENFDLFCRDIYKLSAIQVPENQEIQELNATQQAIKTNFLQVNCHNDQALQYTIISKSYFKLKPYVEPISIDPIKIYILAERISNLNDSERYRFFDIVTGIPTNANQPQSKNIWLTLNFCTGETSYTIPHKQLINTTKNSELTLLIDDYRTLSKDECAELAKYFPALEPEVRMLETGNIALNI
jgi:hypothetical protein